MTNKDIYTDTDIAIVGVGCRFSKAESLDEFWQVLQGEVDPFVDLPADRTYLRDELVRMGFPHATSMKGGFIPDCNFHDAALRERGGADLLLEPQALMLLETALKALADGGFNKIGSAFFDISCADYSSHMHADFLRRHSTGFVAGFLANALEVSGPCRVMESSTGSGLDGLYLAVRSLQKGAVDLALAGACQCLFGAASYASLIEQGYARLSGINGPFTRNASGLLRSEGAAVVVLKRLKDAVSDGDKIYCVIKGMAMNHSRGFEHQSRARVITQALAEAEVQRPNWVEATGTGNPMTDYLELEAMLQLFKEASPVWVSCAKAQLGNAGSAAGMVGLLKTICSFSKRELLPQPTFDAPSSQINWEDAGISLCREAISLEEMAGPVMAGLSGFGLAGANTHIVLAEGPKGLGKPTAASALHFKRDCQIILTEELGRSADPPQPVAKTPATDGAAKALFDIAELAYDLLEIPAAERADLHRQLSPARELKDFGMDSLKTSRLLDLLNEHFGLGLLPSFYLDYPTLGDLAAYLADTRSKPKFSAYQPEMEVAVQLDGMEQQYVGPVRQSAERKDGFFARLFRQLSSVED